MISSFLRTILEFVFLNAFSVSSSLSITTEAPSVHIPKGMITLKGKAKVKKVMWSRRAQEYETKINSGNLIWVAEVVRDLHRGENQAEQSYSERQMYQAALERLAGEFAAIEDIDKDSAASKLEGIMTAA